MASVLSPPPNLDGSEPPSSGGQAPAPGASAEFVLVVLCKFEWKEGLVQCVVALLGLMPVSTSHMSPPSLLPTPSAA